MWIVIGCILVVIGIGMVYFHIPYSKTKSEFKKKFNECMENSVEETDILTKEEVKELPECIQKFYELTKILGKQKQSVFCMYSYNTDFKQNGKEILIDYYEYIFGTTPSYLAYIYSTMAGIPFEGLDSFIESKGGMKGVIAKNFTLFHTTGPEMDKASFATWLAESIFLPMNLLENEITWEELSRLSAKATFTYANMTVSAEYRFNDAGELIEVLVLDRGLVLDDGTMKECPWSVYFRDYREYGEYYLPKVCQCVWHLEEGDLIYYDSRDTQYDMIVSKPFGKE